MWKRVALLVVLVSLLSFPSGSADDPDRPNETTHDTVTCTPVSQGNLLPYGTKSSAIFTSPSLHTFRLVYEIPEADLKKGHAYDLVAANPVNSLVPDFDVLFELKSSGTALHNSLGNEAGTVPTNAIRAYVFMPIGPDTNVAPGNIAQTTGAGEFTFTHC